MKGRACNQKATAVFQGRDNSDCCRDLNDLVQAETHRNENKDLQQNPFHSVLHMQLALDRTPKEE